MAAERRRARAPVNDSFEAGNIRPKLDQRSVLEAKSLIFLALPRALEPVRGDLPVSQWTSSSLNPLDSCWRDRRELKLSTLTSLATYMQSVPTTPLSRINK